MFASIAFYSVVILLLIIENAAADAAALTEVTGYQPTTGPTTPQPGSTWRVNNYADYVSTYVPAPLPNTRQILTQFWNDGAPTRFQIATKDCS